MVQEKVPEPPVGQEVSQVSPERQRVSNVPFVEKKLVVVAEVPVALRKVKFWRVEEAFEIKPSWKTKVVEVAFSPVESVVQAKSSPPPPPLGHEVRQSLPRQIVLNVTRPLRMLSICVEIRLASLSL